MDERRRTARRTGTDRRHNERRSRTLRRRLSAARTDPHSAPERRKSLRRREYRRSLFNRRARPALASSRQDR